MDYEQKRINERQKEFYHSFKKNKPTRLWYWVRNGILTDFRKSVGIEKFVVEQHYDWIGNVRGKKVLDLGCYEGNSLSMFLAENASEYVAIDLSEQAIEHFQKRLKKISTANAIAVDFLSDDFREKDFDLIYAYGVLHHFRSTRILISKLNEKLSPRGRIISYDPTSTSITIWFLRALYRPFQTDRDWEWPFTRSTIKDFEEAFTIIDKRGALGKSKWFFLLNFLPYSQKKKKEVWKKWHEEDWEKSRTSRGRFLRCMQVSLLMEKKE